MGATPRDRGDYLRPETELSLTIEYSELFSFRDRVRSVADRVRSQLHSSGITETLEIEIFEEEEIELRGPEGSSLLVRMDSFHLEITGAPPEWQVHILAALILEEAEVFRFTMVEAGFSTGLKVPRGFPLQLVTHAFNPLEQVEEAPMLDRRFSMTWEWGNATTGFSFHVNDTEDRELWVSLKAREGYLTLPELKSGGWMQAQAVRFNALVARLLTQMGWQP